MENTVESFLANIEKRYVPAAERPKIAANPAWISFLDRLPDRDEFERVLVYTGGVEFAGQQVFDLPIDDLAPNFYQPQEAYMATHWMAHPADLDLSVPGTKSPCDSEALLAEAVPDLPGDLETVAARYAWLRARMCPKDVAIFAMRNPNHVDWEDAPEDVDAAVDQQRQKIA